MNPYCDYLNNKKLNNKHIVYVIMFLYYNFKMASKRLFSTNVLIGKINSISASVSYTTKMAIPYTKIPHVQKIIGRAYKISEECVDMAGKICSGDIMSDFEKNVERLRSDAETINIIIQCIHRHDEICLIYEQNGGSIDYSDVNVCDTRFVIKK
jgi:hypothetical protein